MLAYLKGTVIYKSATFIILENNGVGYQVFVAPHELEKLAVGNPAVFYTFEYVYEERRELYGFKTPEDLEFFLMLIDVQGIGPRMAQKIIGHAPIADIKAAITSDNMSFLGAIPRLGAKTAGKLILELKPKLTHTKKASSHVSSDPDVEEALKRLGYSADEISHALRNLKVAATATPEEKIKKMLTLLKK